MKLYDTWRKAKDIFIKPSLKCYFGKWSKDPCLPVYRRGPSIFIPYRRFQYGKTYNVKDQVMIFTGYKEGELYGKPYRYKCYDWVPKHKLPGNLKNGDLMWNRKTRKKLKKWGLSWIKPMYTLPIWLSFHIYNWDVMYKWKYDNIRYEFPPQFTIVFFGLSLSFWLVPPKSEYGCADHYWEGILNYIHNNNSLLCAVEYTGIWHKLEEDIHYFAIRPEYIKPEARYSYNAATAAVRLKQQDKTIV